MGHRRRRTSPLRPRDGVDATRVVLRSAGEPLIDALLRAPSLVRLRREFGSDLISPAHRLDRLTAGVLLFTRRPEVRGAYQSLFADRRVSKEYRAVAPFDAALSFPIDVANHIVKDSRDLRARVIEGKVNARSRIEITPTAAPETTDVGLVEYTLTPHTGRTHQLRLHMAGLGIPIDNDPLYPQGRDDLAALPGAGDFSRPLRLIAHRLEFDDPLTGARRVFTSTRSPYGPRAVTS